MVNSGTLSSDADTYKDPALEIQRQMGDFVRPVNEDDVAAYEAAQKTMEKMDRVMTGFSRLAERMGSAKESISQ